MFGSELLFNLKFQYESRKYKIVSEELYITETATITVLSDYEAFMAK